MAGAVLLPERLEHQGAGFDLDLAQLLGDQKAMRLVTDDDRRRGGQPLQAQRRLLQHGALTRQRQKLLRDKAHADKGQSRVPAPPERMTGQSMDRSPEFFSSGRSKPRTTPDGVVGESEAARLAAIEDEQRLASA